jgi:hypothetical protein
MFLEHVRCLLPEESSSNVKLNVLNVAKFKQSSIFFYIHTKYLSTVKTNCPKATEEKVRPCN